MPNRSRFLSASAISIALGLAPPPAAAQPAETPQGLVNTYPALSAIEDRSCLTTLADFEAQQGGGALAPLISGAVAPEAVEGADEDLLRCLRAASEAGAGETGEQTDTAAAPEGEARDTDASGDAEIAQDEPTAEPAEADPDPDDETAMAESPAADVSDAGDAEEPVIDGEAPEEENAAEAGAGAIDDSTETVATDGEEAAPTEPASEAEVETPVADMDAAQTETPEEPDTGTTAAETAADQTGDADGSEDPVAETTAGSGDTMPDPDPAPETTPEPAEEERAEANEAIDARPEDDDLAEALAETGDTDTGSATGEAPSTEESETAQNETGSAPEAVQEDTEAVAEAANAPVAAEAAATDTDVAAEDVDTVVVTEEAARSSGEEFATAPAQQGSDGGLNIGQIAAGVIGGVLLNELLGANEEVVTNTGDRVAVQRSDGDYYVLKDENALLRRPGSEIETSRFSDGSTRQIVTREDGSQVITVMAPDGRPLRRLRVLPDGRRVVLFDDTDRITPVDLDDLPPARAEYVEFTEEMDALALRRALQVEDADTTDRRFSLRQVRDLRAVRNLVPTLQLETITFETGSSAILASQAEGLTVIGNAMRRIIDENPGEVFLIEGHTDAVGRASFNLALSDRRAESVALALTEYFDVPPENMVVQGYGESNLRVPSPGPERQNRRAAFRRITPLLNSASIQ